MGAARPGSRKVVGNKRPPIEFEGSLVTRFILVDHTSAHIPPGHIHSGYSQDLDALESVRHPLHPPLIGNNPHGFVIKPGFIHPGSRLDASLVGNAVVSKTGTSRSRY